ncbi:MAG: hypothetical protein PHV30_08825 [Candidatus Margulisbacteria bacterium]|nr:hypothetical protein [Candidatus Margulisiibacteriota bacterium]
MVSQYLIDESDNEEAVNKLELELKIAKISSMIDNVDKRIQVHERRIGKLHNVDERQKTRDKIAMLTQKILENS